MQCKRSLLKSSENMAIMAVFLVRYSGTEMKARVMVEGREADEVRQDADTIALKLLSALANH